jgi:hypothetical protein
MKPPGLGAIVPAMQFLSPLAARAAALLCVAAPLVALANESTPAGAPPEQVSMRHARPASVGGLWCGAGLLGGFTLEIAQQLRDVQAKLIRKGRVREITGHVEGSLLKADPQRDQTMELRAEGDQLRIVAATGVLALATGQSFTRASGDSCSP